MAVSWNPPKALLCIIVDSSTCMQLYACFFFSKRKDHVYYDPGSLYYDPVCMYVPI